MTPHPAHTPQPDSHAYPSELARQSQDQPKGERTRARLMIAACDLLEDAGPQDLTITAICDRAGVAAGTFYVHFTGRQALLSDLLGGYVAFLQRTMRAASRDRPGDTIRPATRAYGAMFAANRGLMRCLIHHQDNFPQARAAFHRLNAEWIDTVVAAALRQTASAPDRHELTRRAYALGAMTDQYFSGLFLSREPGLVAVSQDMEAVIDTLTLIWERGLQP